MPFFGTDEREGEPHRSKPGGDPTHAITANVGPLPVWGWGVVAVGAVFIYRRIVSPSPATPDAASGMRPVASYPTGEASSPIYLIGPPTGGTPATPNPTAPLTPAVPVTPAQPSPTVPDYTPPAGLERWGAGYFVPYSETPIRDRAGNLFQYIGLPAVAEAIKRNGGKLYYQPSPGTFVTTVDSPAPNTPIFMKYDPNTRTWGV